MVDDVFFHLCCLSGWEKASSPVFQTSIVLQLVIFIGGFSGELWDGGLLLLARIPQVPFVFYNLNLTVAWFAFPFSSG